MKSQTPQTRQIIYESIFDNMLDGLAYCQMIFDAQKRPVDFRYILVNKNFAKLTGLEKAEGKKVTKLIPGIAAANPELFEIYGRVALGGKPEKFETYVAPLARWFSVSVYSPKKEFFVALFQNITDQKQIAKDLDEAKTAARNVLEDLRAEKNKLADRIKELEILNRVMIGRELKMIGLKREIATLREGTKSATGEPPSTKIVDKQ